MKAYLQVIAVFIAFLLLIPSIALFTRDTEIESLQQTEPQNHATEIEDIETIKIYNTSDGTIQELLLDDYIIGCVLAQMPATFEMEALKAQAVLAHTYALRRRYAEKENPHSELSGADISDDYTSYQAFFTPKQAQELYGDNYEKYCQKVIEAVKSVSGIVLTYEGLPIVVAFHSISGGKTESAISAWDVGVDYLVSVDSSLDLEQKSCVSVIEITEAEVSARLSQGIEGTDFSENPEDWLTITNKSENGYVKECLVGKTGVSVSGAQVAALLNLRSPNFDYTFENGIFTFTVRGGGHLVGMSQYGANSMAEQGKTYEEILTHYFKGTAIADLSKK